MIDASLFPVRFFHPGNSDDLSLCAGKVHGTPAMKRIGPDIDRIVQLATIG
jgi:hypothetical protein